MNQLKNYIIVVPDVIPSELCDVVLAEYKNSNDWINAVTKTGKNLNIRNCQTIGISFNSVIEKNTETRKKLDSYLFTSASNAIQKYKSKFIKCNIEQDSGYDLLKYSEGCFYIQHVDSFKERPRAVSCSFILKL